MSQTRVRRNIPRVVLGLLAVSGACAGRADAPVAQPETAAAEAKADFENPGGMWMPTQMADHVDTLRTLGLAYDPKALTDPAAFPLGAVISLGGCSASFVSDDGLIITNHHCVIGPLQRNSTPEKNLLVDGFLAADRAQEPSAGPTQRAYVTTSFENVTKDVVAGLETIADPKARYRELEKRVEAIESACEAGRPEVRCDVSSYFEGAEFYKIEALTIRDVRLVHAPAAGIGVYGGEIDNWRWPRHTGDYAFLRAYVGPDGKPADYAKENVPYRPPHHLKVATGDLDPGDLVMVAGYPGRTDRLKTADEVSEAVSWYYPQRLDSLAAYIGLIEGMAKRRPELGITAASALRGMHNVQTNTKGMLDGLVKDGLAERKKAIEAQLRAWIETDPARVKEYGGVLDEIAKLNAETRKTRDHDAGVQEIARASRLLQVGATLSDLAKERAKPKAEQRLDEKLTAAKQSFAAMASAYDPELDRAMLKLALQRVSKLPEGQRPDAVLRVFLGDKATFPASDAAIDTALDRLYGQTKLGDAATRLRLAETITAKSLKANPDPFVAAALAFEGPRQEVEQRQAAHAGAMAALRPRYVAALRGFSDRPLAPDANGTLRITYGTIRGYRPTPSAAMHEPFTTLSQTVKKHTGQEPFDLPDPFLAVAKTAGPTPFVDPDLKEVPVNFLADLDITGGNSGSATLNAKGEIIGLVFDGNYEAIASNWVFTPEVTRSIHVDIRYVLWVMDEVDKAHHLLEEMGVEPRSRTATSTTAAPNP